MRSAPGPLLVINNAPFQQVDGRLWVEPPTGVFLEELCARLPRVEVAQGRVSFDESNTQNSHAVDAIEGLEVSALRWELSSRRARLWSYLRALPWILANTRRAEFLYVFMPGHLSFLYCLCARLLRRPYGVYLRGELSERWLRRALAGARFAVVANPGTQAVAAAVCTEIHLVLPMVELTREDVVQPRPARGPGALSLLFVGRVEPPKGIAELLDALVIVRRRHPQLALHLVGWAAELEHFRAEARRLGLEDAVVFHGVVKDRERLRAHFGAADLFVLPTHTEGFPRVLYEAMAFGVPILTTFVGGIPALMRDGENCLEIPRKDAAGLARVLERALGDPALRDRLAAGGHRTVSEFLDPSRPSHAQQVAEGVRQADFAP